MATYCGLVSATIWHFRMTNRNNAYTLLKKQIVSNFKNRFIKSTLGIKYRKPAGYFVVHIAIQVQKYLRPSSPGQFFFLLMIILDFFICTI